MSFWVHAKWMAVVAIFAGGGKVFADESREIAAGSGNLVVHEWGVAVRHKTTAGTVLSSPTELTAGLPAFVTVQKNARKLQAQGWDKPVIWFYGGEGMQVSLKLTANEGFATANFPDAALLTRKFGHHDRKAMMDSLLTESAGFSWEGTLTKAPTGKVLDVPKEHWWQIARDAGGMYFNGKNASERFIFYEATAIHEPAVLAKVTAENLTLTNSDAASSGQVVVIVNPGNKHFAFVADGVDGKGELKIDRDAVMKEACSAEQVLAICTAQWKHFGMTAAEGEAIATVWKTDLLKPGRLLLISRMPPKAYDAMFTLVVEPKPKELVRVGMVFDALESQAEAGAWVPETLEIQKAMTKAAKDLASDEQSVRDAASATLEKAGEHARGLLEILASSKNIEVRRRAEALLQKLTQVADTPAHSGRDEKGVLITPLQGP